MDEDFAHELEEMLESIATAEVMSVYFPTLWKSVVLDTRSSEKEGPMVSVMPMVASPQERLRNIRRLRPNFPRLNNLTLIPWVRSVDSLVRLGVWDRLVQRFKDSGHQEAVDACGSVLDELKRLERAELFSAVQGNNYHTIWSADR